MRCIKLQAGAGQGRQETHRTATDVDYGAIEQCRRTAEEGSGLRHMVMVMICSPATVRKALAGEPEGISPRGSESRAERSSLP